MKRIVQPELLDVLPPADSRAIRSRRDLRRVNTWMRNPVLMARELERHLNGHAPNRITELGAGDGSFLLHVSRLITSRWENINVVLLDMQAIVTPGTVAAFSQRGWQAEAVVADVFEKPLIESDVIVANLFLHHFEEPRLAELLRVISQRTKLFIAIEPRRAAWPLFCSRMLWGIGCNAVTRHDAAVSVRAGFSGTELSSLWPDRKNWRLFEQNAGPFSHLFVARKVD